MRVLIAVAACGLCTEASAHVTRAPDAAHHPIGDALLGTFLAAAVLLYALGVARVWGRAGIGRGIRLVEAVRFAIGMLAVAAALLSPIDTLAAQSFAMHMIEHELLMVLAAPLLVLARPLEAWVWALPGRELRYAVAALARVRPFARLRRAMTAPLGATCLHALALWIWHAPLLFAAALASLPVHLLQHASFFVSALAFWWAMFGGAARTPGPACVACLFTTMLHTSALGALLTFAPSAWFAHGDIPISGLTPLEDQQLGGLVMWVPGGLAYVVGALLVVRGWLAPKRTLLRAVSLCSTSTTSQDAGERSGHRATRMHPPRGAVGVQRAC